MGSVVIQRGVLGIVVVSLVCLLVQHTTAFNEEKPIYKWSPVWLSYNRYLYKRYNEEKPIYKWNPSYLGGFAGKRQESESCIPQFAVCAYRRSYNTAVTKLQCCEDMQCTFIGSQYLCLNPDVPAINIDQTDLN